MGVLVQADNKKAKSFQCDKRHWHYLISPKLVLKLGLKEEDTDMTGEVGLPRGFFLRGCGEMESDSALSFASSSFRLLFSDTSLWFISSSLRLSALRVISSFQRTAYVSVKEMLVLS